jgi:hypothetical protein
VLASTDPASCGWGFGSDGRVDAGVGSDLDLLLIDAHAVGPQHQPLLAWPALAAGCGADANHPSPGIQPRPGREERQLRNSDPQSRSLGLKALMPRSNPVSVHRR